MTVHHIRPDARDRRAIAAYLDGCRAGWREQSCLFAARQIQPDQARLRRVLYQAKVSDPLAFRPNPAVVGTGLHSVPDSASLHPGYGRG